MRPRNLKRKDRWYLPKDHPFVRQGYVYDRKEIAYICVGSYRKSTNIPFLKSNKDLVLKLLEKQIKDINFTSLSDITTVSQAIEMYYKVNSNLTDTRKYNLTRSVKMLITKDFHLHEADAIRNHIIDNIKKAKETYKQNTISVYVSALSQIFNFLQLEGYIKKNPIHKAIVNEKIDQAKVLTFSKDELDMIFKAVESKKDYYFFYRFMYLSGCRVNEAANLKWTDVKDDYIEVNGKGNRIRTIPLKPFPEISELLTEMKLYKETDKLFKYKTASYVQKLTKVLLKLKIYCTGKGTHSFRKTRENELIHNHNFSTKIIAELLGHSEAVQRKHYLQVLKTDELSAKLMREIEINKSFAH